MLVLPLAALLCAQWPLRELVQAHSRQANDAAQVLFPLVMACGVGYAGQRDAHLVAGPPLDAAATPAPATAGESEDDLVRRRRHMGPSPLPEDGPTLEPPGAAAPAR